MTGAPITEEALGNSVLRILPKNSRILGRCKRCYISFEKRRKRCRKKLTVNSPCGTFSARGFACSAESYPHRHGISEITYLRLVICGMRNTAEVGCFIPSGFSGKSAHVEEHVRTGRVRGGVFCFYLVRLICMQAMQFQTAAD